MLWADVGSWLAPRRSATLDETNEREDDHARISSQVRVRLEASRIPGLVTEVFALTSSRVRAAFDATRSTSTCCAGRIHVLKIQTPQNLHTYSSSPIMSEHAETLIRSAFGHNYDLERRALDASSMFIQFHPYLCNKHLLLCRKISRWHSRAPQRYLYLHLVTTEIGSGGVLPNSRQSSPYRTNRQKAQTGTE